MHELAVLVSVVLSWRSIAAMCRASWTTTVPLREPARRGCLGQGRCAGV